MLKKAIIFLFVVLYLYTLTFDIFLSKTIRLPSPLMFGIPLIALFFKSGEKFLYLKEAIVLLVAEFIYYGIALSNLNDFLVNFLTIIVCLLFFNFFIGKDRGRFIASVSIFFGLLLLSAIIMVLNHMYPAPINQLRSRLIESPIEQSPSGIASFIFTFGYQLAPLVTFLCVSLISFRKSWILKIVIFMACLGFIFLGMQRSVLIAFSLSCLLFLILYYRYKALPVIGLILIFAVVFSKYFIAESSNYDNILSKNERNADENRGNLMTENLNIYANYPFGLMFYGKNWNEVTKYNTVYSGGITSHNAYLMFFTYLGPFLSIMLFLLCYFKFGKVFKTIFHGIRDKKNALLISLFFAFLAASLNALFHNAWLFSANGPTVFLYFATLHLYNQYGYNEVEATEDDPHDHMSEEFNRVSVRPRPLSKSGDVKTHIKIA